MRVYEAKIVYSLVSLGESVKLGDPEKVVAYLKEAFAVNPLQETGWVVLLDRRAKPIARHMVSQGTLTSTLMSAKEVFRPAILAGACAVIVAHNHPSGDPAPSAADVAVTRSLREAAKAIDIELLDHVVVGDLEQDPAGRGWFSFRQAGYL